ncbi:class I SAM-dependent rRNA methyltransferase [Thiohalobacter sp. IOR34]|uniref:class I SAM-dependent rRNA methyltransferase n=1 Tax=Thiohalobacter sp. IOR34 TaxID=3057176 RepID=UPI0025AF03A7|nr:class I SAM-dependent rRNA methyltransferase [Thiohalobacter sp. IOR34]WJW75891.1 class I SAM-dependent rRNA methyltransferase [Thiohalobacter sp. IOR34]
MTAEPAAEHLPALRLKKREERRLRAGHLWVYSNEVDTARTPLSAFEPGQPVEIQQAGGKPLGTGYVNPHSLICARLVSRDPRHVLGRSLLVHRLNIALALRERLHATPCYRLVYGESDGLPGLVVDRYGDWLSVQIGTAGMERVRDAVVEALDKVLRPRGMVLRNDAPVREQEGLERYVEVLGEVPETVELVENGCRFRVSLHSGQKTGWFYDQADNRARLARYVRGARVLDLFSYVGGWGIQALRQGAASALCVDASAEALARVAENAGLNEVAARLETRRGDAFEVLKALREEGERFDVVICDPPAFIKRRKDLKVGSEAYQRLAQQAMQLLTRDGLLVNCSCSFHMQADSFQKLTLRAARHLGRELQLLERGQQSADHPVHPAIPETDYLKVLFCRALAG